MLKVLFVLPATAKGGAEIRLLGMLPEFTRIDPFLLGHQAVLGDLSNQGHIRRFDDFPGCLNPYSYKWTNACAYAKAIAAISRSVKPDLCFGWMHTGSMFVALAATLYGLRTRVAGSVLGPLSDYFRLQGVQPSFYDKAFLAFASHRLQGLVVPSVGTGKDLIERFHAPPRKVQAIHNGVDIDGVRDKSRAFVPALRKDRPWVLSASRLSPEKGLDVQLQAFALLRRSVDAQFVILGEGSERGAVEAEIARLGLQGHVFLPGFQENPFPWFAQADVFLMASRFEGFPMSLLEAMALGLPVVSTACPYGPREMIQHEVSGLLSPVDNAEALAAHLVNLFSDRAYAERLAEGARTRAFYFSKQKMISEYENYLFKLCNTRGG